MFVVLISVFFVVSLFSFPVFANILSFSYNSTYNTSHQYSISSVYGFQVNITNTTWSAGNVSNVTFELGRPNGVITNYTNSTGATNLGILSKGVRNDTAYLFYINFTQVQLGYVGTYNFTWHANVSDPAVNLWNNTPVLSFTVKINESTFNYYNATIGVLNGTIAYDRNVGDFLYNPGGINASINNNTDIFTGDGGTFLLEINETQFTGINSSYIPGFGRYNYTFRYISPTNGNYTSASKTYWVNVTQNTSNPIRLKFSLTNSTDIFNNNITSKCKNLTIEGHQLFANERGYSGTIRLEKNDTTFTNATAYEWFTPGSYKYYINDTGNANYTANSSTTATTFYLVFSAEDNSGACSVGGHCSSGYCVNNICRATATFCGDSVCDTGETCTNCGSDCGGCAGTSTSTPYIQNTKLKSIVKYTTIKSGTKTIFDFGAEDVAIGKIEAKVNKVLYFVELVAEKLSSRPMAITKSPGSAYQYIEIDDVGDKLKDKTDDVRIEFEVTKAWIIDGGYDINNVIIKRWNDDKWNSLVTEKIGETTTSYRYEAITPGFSTFVITVEEKTGAGEPGEVCNNNGICGVGETFGNCPNDCPLEEAECTVGEGICSDGKLQQCNVGGTAWEVLEVCEFGCDNGACRLTAADDFEKEQPPTVETDWTIIGVLIVIVIVVAWFLTKNTKKKKK